MKPNSKDSSFIFPLIKPCSSPLFDIFNNVKASRSSNKSTSTAVSETTTDVKTEEVSSPDENASYVSSPGEATAVAEDDDESNESAARSKLRRKARPRPAKEARGHTAKSNKEHKKDISKNIYKLA